MSQTSRVGDPEGNLAVPQDWIPVTLGGGNVDLITLCGGVCRALRADTAGTIAVKMGRLGTAGTTRALKFAAGETRYGIFLQIIDASTTATGVEAAA